MTEGHESESTAGTGGSDQGTGQQHPASPGAAGQPQPGDRLQDNPNFGGAHPGTPYAGSPAPSGSAPYPGAAYEGAAYEGAPYEGAPYEGAPYQGNPYQAGPYSGSSYPSEPLGTAPSTPRPEHHSVRTSLALLLVAAGVGTGVAAGRLTSGSSNLGLTTTQAASGSAASGTGSASTGTGSGSTGTGTGTGTGSGSTGTGTGSGSTGTGTGPGTTGGTGGWGWGSGGPGGGPAGAPTATSTLKATAAQQVGVVDVNTVLKYDGAAAAGTGMVLTSGGRVLTNNHVVAGATTIKVTVVSTGKTYTATVVGTDATDDIAVLQLKDASGLATAKISTTATVKVGDSVTGVGNAGGVGGTPSAATGKVTAVNQSITASDEGGVDAQKLTGLIETDADIVAGDSGGPLYNAAGSIVGIDTAGASTNQYSTADDSYAIPITTAVRIADQIQRGKSSSTIHIGSTAFLGISVSTTSTGVAGALISGVVVGGPAAKAGIVAGDVIVSIDGRAVADPAGLTALMAGHHGGDKVSVKWTTAAGKSEHATITTIAGPAR